jgi:hypothetical protein
MVALQKAYHLNFTNESSFPASKAARCEGFPGRSHGKGLMAGFQRLSLDILACVLHVRVKQGRAKALD